MTIPSPNVAVYTEDLVLTPEALATLGKWVNSLPSGPTKDQLLKDLQNATSAADVATAGFDTIIVGLWHVHPAGEIYYNDFPFNIDTATALCDSFKALKSTPGSTVKAVLISFGGGNWAGHPRSVSDDDYPNMKANWVTFQATLLKLLSNGNADGVDWDYEPEETPFDTAFIAQITNEMAAKKFLVTAAPYTDQSSWQTVIENTLFEGGTLPGNNFAWWNLQLYGGADYGDWVTALDGIKTGLTDKQVQAFLVPGYSVPDCGSSPSGQIGDLKKQYSSLNGAFIWNYTGIKTCASGMAQSIRKALTS